jgi:hypothetical protein
MKTDLYSTSKIFTERLLRIPDYQRGYAWTERQLKDFWNDLIQLEQGKNHYVGVLTLEQVDSSNYQSWEDDKWIIESKHYEPYYIVDGQQRLTTIIVFIESILETIGKDGVLNYTSSDEIRKKFIYETKQGGISRSYIFGYEVDNPSYEFLKISIFGEQIDNCKELRETIYINNLFFAKAFFIEQLKELKIPEIESLYTKTTQHFLFNIYSMSNDIDVHVSFETMNNRGKPLSHLELLKNRLIYLTTKFDSEEYEKEKLRKAINECWKTIYHQLGRNKNNPLDDDMFLFNHFVLFFGNSLITEEDQGLDEYRYRFLRRGYRGRYQEYLLEEKFTTKSLLSGELTIPELYEYVKSLKNSVETWYEISNPTQSSLKEEEILWLEKINRASSQEVRPLIMMVLQKENISKERIKFLKNLEILLFMILFTQRSYLFRLEPSKFLEWASKLSQGHISIDRIITQMKDYSTRIVGDDKKILRQVSDAFTKDKGFYRWTGLKYFLFEYEQNLKLQSKNYSDKLTWDMIQQDERDNKTIEHIYPQRAIHPLWKKAFEKYTSQEKTILRHSLGNLVLLSQTKNSSFQNKPFTEKLGNEQNTIGFKYGSYSEIELTSYSEWTAKEILLRGIKLIKFMSKRWNIDFGTDDIAEFT